MIFCNNLNMYIAIGIFGGLALNASIQGAQTSASARVCQCASASARARLTLPVAGDDGSELLAVLTQSPRIHVFTKVMTYIFPLAAIITTIPIFSIIIRYAPTLLCNRCRAGRRVLLPTVCVAFA